MRQRDELDHDDCDCTPDTPMDQLCSHHRHWRKIEEREAAAEQNALDEMKLDEQRAWKHAETLRNTPGMDAMTIHMACIQARLLSETYEDAVIRFEANANNAAFRRGAL
jgi:hypothetical protein